MTDKFEALMSGAQFGSFYDATSKSPYTTHLGTEIAILQRKIYLPLLPQERLSYAVLKAYDYLIETEQMPESEYHPMNYWSAEEVYADFYEGNFSIPMLFPNLTEPGVNPEEFESTLTRYEAANLNAVGGNLETDGFYVKGNYIKLKIPKYIALMFRSTIPRNTKFLVNFSGGNSQVDNISIIGLHSIGDNEDDSWSSPSVSYHGLLRDTDEDIDEKLQELGDIIIDNIEIIEREENRRREECDDFAKEEDAIYA